MKACLSLEHNTPWTTPSHSPSSQRWYALLITEEREAISWGTSSNVHHQLQPLSLLMQLPFLERLSNSSYQGQHDPMSFNPIDTRSSWLYSQQHLTPWTPHLTFIHDSHTLHFPVFFLRFWLLFAGFLDSFAGSSSSTSHYRPNSSQLVLLPFSHFYPIFRRGIHSRPQFQLLSISQWLPNLHLHTRPLIWPSDMYINFLFNNCIWISQRLLKLIFPLGFLP